MRLLSGLGFDDIEEYLSCLPGIETLEAVRDKKSLMEAAASFQYDRILVSRELAGSEGMEYVIKALSAGSPKDRRVVFIYGEYDDACDDFIRLLISHEVYDYFVGDEIDSYDLMRLLFKPSGRDAAYGYFQSRYDNAKYFKREKRIARRSISEFTGRTKAGSALNGLLKYNNSGRNSVDRTIISIIANQATGKSHTAWNLGYCFSRRGYATSLVNIDRGYSANLFFDIDDIYYDLLDFTLQNNAYKDILENCCKRKSLSIITGRLGDETQMKETDFDKLLYNVRTKSDITIIDTRTGLSDITKLSVRNSICDLLIFDCDIMHYHMNMKMLEELEEDFIPEKTIAVINNTNIKSSSHKFIYNELKGSGIPFRDIAFISSCGFLSSEVMHTGVVPYQAAGEEYKEFVRDMDILLDKLGARKTRNILPAGIFGR